MSVQILFRRGTAVDWTTADPVLGSGEPGFETDTGKFKIGDGSNTWSVLQYASTFDSPIENLSNVTITSPTSGQVLKYNGTAWVNDVDSGGSGVLPTRSSIASATNSLAIDASSDLNMVGFSAYALMKIETSAAAWVRIYVSGAARLADASRLEGEDPLPGSGVIAEIITTGAQAVLITPGTIGFNNETPSNTSIPVRVTNKSDSAAAITVTLTAIQLEA